jgi:hypothetical protein
MEAERSSIDAEYTRRLLEQQLRVRQQNRLFHSLGRRRALTIGIIVALIILTEKEVSAAPKALVLIPTLIVGMLIVWRARAARACRRAVLAGAYYRCRLDSLHGEWAGRGESGNEYLDGRHAAALDLDLFGVGSLFELICTARTRFGKDVLASWLSAPAAPAEIRARQDAVADLRPRLDLQEDLIVLATDLRAPSQLSYFIRAAAEPVPAFLYAAWWLGLAASALAVAGLVAGWLFGMSSVFVLAALLPHVAFATCLRRPTNRLLEPAFAARSAFTTVAAILARLEREPFCAARLRDLHGVLHRTAQPASQRLAPFVRVLRLELPAFLLGLRPQLALGTVRWRRQLAEDLTDWLQALGQVEALCSLANHYREHPGECFPELVEDGLRLEAIGLGHPFLPEGGCVRNDVALTAERPLLLVSGSNMSGKSTFLRTVGVNVVLATCGGTVRATRLRLAPFAVGATLRVQDSLREGRSRFFAEGVRIRQLLDMARGSAPLLFLLDELFQGTNSRDRRTAAEAVLRELLERKAVGIVTTHDLALTEIADRLTPRAANVHFADEVAGGKMTFDYRLRSGVVPASNALALLRVLGIEV